MEIHPALLFIIGFALLIAGWLSSEWNYKNGYFEEKTTTEPPPPCPCWQTGFPRNNSLVWVKKYRVNSSDYGIGRYLDWDKAICGLSGEWDADPTRDEWQQVEMPK
jgi:hypothetical protein